MQALKGDEQALRKNAIFALKCLLGAKNGPKYPKLVKISRNPTKSVKPCQKNEAV